MNERIKEIEQRAVLAHLNSLAEYLEKGELKSMDFLAHVEGALKLSADLYNIDRIEEKMFMEQAKDITMGKYTRFEWPKDYDEEYPRKDLQGYPHKIN